MNKRLIIGLALVIVFVMTLPAQAGEFNDVPRDHWAYNSLERVAQAGLIEGYQNGRFKGEEELSRYQVAALTSRVMDKIEADDAELSSEVADAIQTLATEFDTELVKLKNEMDELTRVKISGETGVEYKDAEKTGSGASYIDTYLEDFNDDDSNDDDDKVL